MLKRMSALIMTGILFALLVLPVWAAEVTTQEVQSKTDSVQQSAEAKTEEIKIFSREDLVKIAEQPSASYVLMNDIDMSGAEWKPVPLTGSFNGGGHTIYNLSVSEVGDTHATTVDGNDKQYDTCAAGLFSVAQNAVISDLNILGANININTEHNCFAAILAGCAENTVIKNCSVHGRVYLYMTDTMCGVAGLVGFGSGEISGCTVDAECVFVDGNKEIKCEEFLGGVLSCGFSDISNCNVKLRGYTSVHGYVHNGGIVGMFHKHDKTAPKRDRHVKNCEVDVYIAFFEDNTDRRAYCKSFVGERLCDELIVSDNKEKYYEKLETKDFNTILSPEKCVEPTYYDTTVSASCASYGYSTHTCAACGYSYTDSYIHPAHTPGEWIVVSDSDYENEGVKERYCTACGVLAGREVIPPMSYVESINISHATLELAYKDECKLDAVLTPSTASDGSVMWSSSDESVITVDQGGNVMAKGRGTAVITCSSFDGNTSAVCPVTVSFTWWQWIIYIVLFGWLWY